MRCDSARWQAAAVVSTRCRCAPTACVLGRVLSLFSLCGVLWCASTRTGLLNAQDASVRPQSVRLHDLTSTCPLLQRSTAGAAPTEPLLWLWCCLCMYDARFSVCSCSWRVLIPLRGRAYIRLSSMFAGVLPNRCAGCLTWTCFTDFFKLQLWAPDWVRYGSVNKQS